MCVVSTNDGIGQLEVLDDGLKLSLVELGDLTAEDGGDLAGLVRPRPQYCSLNTIFRCLA